MVTDQQVRRLMKMKEGNKILLIIFYCLFLSFCVDCIRVYGSQLLFLDYSESKVYQYEIVEKEQ